MDFSGTLELMRVFEALVPVPAEASVTVRAHPNSLSGALADSNLATET
jgi:hypothetical protein